MEKTKLIAIFGVVACVGVIGIISAFVLTGNASNGGSGSGGNSAQVPEMVRIDETTTISAWRTMSRRGFVNFADTMKIERGGSAWIMMGRITDFQGFLDSFGESKPDPAPTTFIWGNVYPNSGAFGFAFKDPDGVWWANPNVLYSDCTPEGLMALAKIESNLNYA